MTSEIYLCQKCKDQREYLYDKDGNICAYVPCKCNINQKAIIFTKNGIKPLDKAFKTIGELRERN